MTKLKQTLHIIFGCAFGRHRPFSRKQWVCIESGNPGAWRVHKAWLECQYCGRTLEQPSDGKWHVL